MATAYHMVNYRRVTVKGEKATGPTFEAVCRLALDAQDQNAASLWLRANDRIFASTDGNKQIVLNRVADLTEAVFGELCLLDKAGLQAMIGLQASQVQLSNITVAEIFNLQERTAPQGQTFIRGMLYWICFGNHLLFVKLHSFGSEDLSSYIEWLFKQCTSTLKADTAITIEAKLDRSIVGNRIGDIKSLRLSGKSSVPMSVTSDTSDTKSKVVETTRKVGGKMVEFAQALPVVKALLGERQTESLVHSLGPEEYLAVDATIKVRGRRTRQSKERFDKIVHDVAEMTDAKVQVEGKDGKMSEGDAILRTRMPFDLPQDGSNFLDFDNVADQLQEVYRRFISDKKISVE